MTAPPDLRRERPHAIAVARAFVDLLEGTYDQLIVAGSLRRRLARIGALDVVAVPTIVHVQSDLLGDTTTEHDLLHARMQDLLDDGPVSKRLDRNGTPRWGPTLKSLTFQDTRIDLFCPDADRFGWILLLRTGPAAFSRQLVIERGRKTRDGRPGLLPATILPREGYLTWRTSGERISTPTEGAACDVLGIPYVEPWTRT